MSSSRTLSRWAGALYLTTHATSVGALLLYGAPPYDEGSALAGRQSTLLGGLCELLLAVAVVGTAAALFPMIVTWLPAVAVAYLGLRTLEASVILVGVVSLMPVTARPGTTVGPNLEPAVAQGLRLVHDWTFLIGPGLLVPFHTIMLAWCLLQFRLAPRTICMLGLVGGALVGISNLAVLSGHTGAIAAAAVPVFAWEVSFAVYLIVRGIPSSAARGVAYAHRA